MQVRAFINIYFDGKHCWSGSDFYEDIAAAKRVGLALAKHGVKCLGQRLLEFDTDTFVSDIDKEIILEDNVDTRRTLRPRGRPRKIQSTGESDS